MFPTARSISVDIPLPPQGERGEISVPQVGIIEWPLTRDNIESSGMVKTSAVADQAVRPSRAPLPDICRWNRPRVKALGLTMPTSLL